MKRNINLQELSRDHHHGLLLGWKIRQGIKKGTPVESVVHYVRYFWNEALYPHFAEEEEDILSFLNANNELKQQTLNEHLSISQLIEKLNTESELLELADLLDKHIRFEERVLFPYLEMSLSEEQLNEIGQKISISHKDFEDNYSNQFWKHEN